VQFGRDTVSGFLGKFGVPQIMSDYIFNQIEPIAFYLVDLNWQIALPYIPQRFVDELNGIADGSNGLVSFDMLMRSNMIPEITQAACTVFGAWGEATADGKLYHLRALDWMPDAPVNKYPTVILYEPTEEGHPFVNIGFLGLIGSLTAMSKHGITIGEKVFWVADPS